MWQDRQDLGLTSILKNRCRRHAPIEGVLPGLGARAAAVAPLKIIYSLAKIQKVRMGNLSIEPAKACYL